MYGADTKNLVALDCKSANFAMAFLLVFV